MPSNFSSGKHRISRNVVCRLLTRLRPGLRERFIFSQHRYCSNTFWDKFTNNFRISWPFEFRDCYNVNLETGKLSVAAEFKSRIADLGAWTMSHGFFERFPELYGDIPAFQTIPRVLMPWGGAGGKEESAQYPIVSMRNSAPEATNGHWAQYLSMNEPAPTGEEAMLVI